MNRHRMKRPRPLPKEEPGPAAEAGEEIPLIDAQDPAVIDQQEGTGWAHDTTRRFDRRRRKGPG